MSQSPTFAIDQRRIGAGEPPYIIAELSGNHNGNLDRAIELMAAAKKAGADAVKLQTYTADTITIDHDGPGFVVDLPLWKKRKLYDLYQEAHTPWQWHEALFAKGRELGITVFSSPFDTTAVDMLERLQAPAYKIASFELVDTNLIERCAAAGKPLIISTGMGSESEIHDAVAAARKGGAKGLALLQCVSAYPAPAEEANLANIPELARKFDVVAGLSDHTLGNAVAVASIALGARIIEKHITLRRADGGVDSAFSLEPEELAQLVSDCRAVASAAGGPRFGVKPSEQGAVIYRRSLYVVADIKRGEPFSEANVRSIRPGYGLPPKYLTAVMGRHATRNIKRGEPLAVEMIADLEI
jgi:N-acetylneuraminate synthase